MERDCTLCGKPMRTDEYEAHRRLTGWAKKRSQGGTNAVSLTTLTDDYAHGSCVKKASKGINPQQSGLFP